MQQAALTLYGPNNRPLRAERARRLSEADRFYAQRARRRHGAPASVLELQIPPMPIAIGSAVATRTRPIQWLDRFLTHPGYGVEPQRVVQIYRTAEYGWTMEQCDLFDDIIENDGHLRSVIHARVLAVAGKQWQVMHGGDAAIDQKAAELLQSALRESNFDDLVAHLLSARYMGWAGTEIDWRVVDGDTLPLWFVNVPHRRFCFDEYGRPRILNGIDDTTGELLRAGSWVFGRNSVSGLTARSGLMRTATWYALFKRWSWRDWVIYAEKFGIPLVIGKYDSDASEEDRTALETAVESIGEAGQATMSDETMVEIHEAQKGGAESNLHAGIVREANNEISKLITGSTLTVETGGPGSFALGKVHESRSFDLVLADAAFVARRFRADIAKPFLAYNGFADAACPELIIHVTRETDPLTRAKLAETLQAMGLELDTEQLREEFQFRKPPTTDRTLSPPAPTPAPAAGDDAMP